MDLIDFLKALLVFTLCSLPFLILVLIYAGINLKKEKRYKQFLMPFFGAAYCLVFGILVRKLSKFVIFLLEKLASAIKGITFGNATVAAFTEKVSQALLKMLIGPKQMYAVLIGFNLFAMIAYLIIKGIVLAVVSSNKFAVSVTNKFTRIFYRYDELTEEFYLKEEFHQGRSFFKAAYRAVVWISVVLFFLCFYLCKKGILLFPFYPIFAIILIGEVYFYADGLTYEEQKSTFHAEADDAVRITNYVTLREKLRNLFGDKLTADGTTVNNGLAQVSSIDGVLVEIEKEYGFIGENYAKFIRRQIEMGLKPDINYIKSGIQLASGKSLLFNTPFYYKLCPYMFYSMSSRLQKNGKVLVIMGRHGTTDDVMEWVRSGLFSVSHIPDLWKIGVLDNDTDIDADSLDIGLITNSGVHDLKLHQKYKGFLQNITFAVVVEPSRLVTTSQIGLNLLVKNFNESNNTVFCSVDRNCDGLVDALSHILMTNITEVSATEFPDGTSSYMCWLADGDYLHHRLISGISRYLGIGTELSFVALKNQVAETVWYGGDAFPVKDAHWIAKQYYYNLLQYANLPQTQESFDKYLKTSYNSCNEKTNENRYVSVEDEYFNLFEVKRVFSTIANQQGFINVISTEYLLREYMTVNNQIFTADPKAIPYIAADFARTDRNIVLELCLRLCLCGITKEQLEREFLILKINSDSSCLESALWNKICEMYGVYSEPRTICVNGHCFDSSVISRKRDYIVETGTVEDVFSIKSKDFAQAIIDNLQSAKYIAEKDSESNLLGTELKGHIFQKYLPGQKFTLNGKFYEMENITDDNQILLRRAADHINGRFVYRQIRKYNLTNAADADYMGSVQTVNNIVISSLMADFTVDTPAYWRLPQYNDFEKAQMHIVNQIPRREYLNKRIIKLDFSYFGEAFTEEIRVCLTVLFNEVFRTLFADNSAYIVALTEGDFEKPLTYSLSGEAVSTDAIYIIEDSQLDIGLLVSVQRSLERIFQIVSDYLNWNEEEIIKSLPVENAGGINVNSSEDVPDADEELTGKSRKKKCFILRIIDKIKAFFKKIKDKKKKRKVPDEPQGGDILPEDEPQDDGFLPVDEPQDDLYLPVDEPQDDELLPVDEPQDDEFVPEDEPQDDEFGESDSDDTESEEFDSEEEAGEND